MVNTKIMSARIKVGKLNINLTKGKVCGNREISFRDMLMRKTGLEIKQNNFNILLYYFPTSLC